MANTLIFFAEKMWVAFELPKLLIFLQQNINVFEYNLATTVNEFVINELVNDALFVCVEVLRPSQPSGVMLSAVSWSNHTFTGQA